MKAVPPKMVLLHILRGSLVNLYKNSNLSFLIKAGALGCFPAIKSSTAPPLTTVKPAGNRDFNFFDNNSCFGIPIAKIMMPLSMSNFTSLST